MNIIPLTQKNHSIWNQFCVCSDDAWFWHTTRWIEYTLNYSPQLYGDNKSFMVSDGDRILGIFPLIVENNGVGNNIVREFSFGGSFGVTPALSNEFDWI